MNIEFLRHHALSLPGVVECFPFDESTLVFKVADKMFLCVDLEHAEYASMKCDPDYALELRDRHPEITGAWHMNKKHWNQLDLEGLLPDELIQKLIRHSYDLVVKKLPRKTREQWHLERE